MVELVDRGAKKGRGGGGGEASGDDWRLLLTRNREGKIEGNLHNIILVIEHDERLSGLFWLNESSNQVVMARAAPWPGSDRDEFVDGDAAELAAWLQHPDRYGMRCGDDTVLKAVIAVARRHRRHPIREYLAGLEWDGKPRIATMLPDLFGASDTHYTRQVAPCFMVGAVARMLWFDPKNPALGAKVDFMLVLEGPQGKKKSTSLSELFGSYWFVETVESPNGKDFYQVIQGCWGVEIGEMDSFGKADVTAVKVAITRRTDKFRAPYERMPNSYRRECVFVGTTNDREYLKDATGGRRFLPVRADGDVDVPGIIAQRDQLWAEAVHLFREGFQYWVLPDDAPAEQAARYIADSWEGRIERWLAGSFRHDRDGIPIAPERLRFQPGRPVEWTTTDELLEYAVGVDPAKHTKADQMRISAIMKRFGQEPIVGDFRPEDSWDHVRQRWFDGGREWRWVRVPAPGGEPPPKSAGDNHSKRGADEPDF
ncbi:MAG TPA: virulence factor [Gammaproteobacteria bacterium]|nr:virulence factor [Gammaproteobacteria bacterium]MCH76989.1 virulence factor [Gammaproteobacteria bacterium]